MDSAVFFDVNTTLGAFQIGVLLSYLLLGVTITQTYIYYSRFPDDSPKLKALVAFVLVCEIAHAICLGHTLYVDTISEYAHPERVQGAPPKSFTTAIFLSGLIGACVQAFFSFRIYGLSKTLDWDVDKVWLPPTARIPHHLTTYQLCVGRHYVTMKHNFIWAGVFSVVPRLFSNTLLARATLRALNEAPLSFSMPSLIPGNGLPSRSYQITKVTQVAYDAEASHDQSDHV
ncbi:hypothetical protein B0H13DRAFT_2356172 [Mycena leptocephala]|nr:hypothetical protein B0H13DRAFT_2356172 [Mycena leptocephala]